MARVHLIVILVALSSAVALGVSWPFETASAQPQGGPPGANDAGSGEDAGDSPESALAIPSARRVWNANLTPTGTDADWYRLSSEGAFCAVADTTVQSPGYLTLAGSPQLEERAEREAMPHQARRLALAAPAGSTPTFGVQPPMISNMVAEGGNGNGNPPGPSSPGRYTFSFTLSSAADLDPEGDGESPEAGATPATSAPLAADCSAGLLAGDAADTIDRYHLDVSDARLMTLSFVVASGAAAHVQVLDPTGAVAATLASGDAEDVWLGASGRWTVVVSQDAAPASLLDRAALLGARVASAGITDTVYLLAATDGPGDTEPCRPSCSG